MSSVRVPRAGIHPFLKGNQLGFPSPSSDRTGSFGFRSLRTIYAAISTFFPMCEIETGSYLINERNYQGPLERILLLIHFHVQFESVAVRQRGSYEVMASWRLSCTCSAENFPRRFPEEKNQSRSEWHPGPCPWVNNGHGTNHSNSPVWGAANGRSFQDRIYKIFSIYLQKEQSRIPWMAHRQFSAGVIHRPRKESRFNGAVRITGRSGGKVRRRGEKENGKRIEGSKMCYVKMD